MNTVTEEIKETALKQARKATWEHEEMLASYWLQSEAVTNTRFNCVRDQVKAIASLGRLAIALEEHERLLAVLWNATE